jgi:SAM-dependent methyltransferase
MPSQRVVRVAKALPTPAQDVLRKARIALRRQLPPRTLTRLERRLDPVARHPYARGTPIDRYYIDHFFRRWNGPLGRGREIRGVVLEFYNTEYANAFGGWGRPDSPITAVEIVDIAQNPNASVRADIADAPQLSSQSFDVVICTQVLQLVFDVQAAVATLARILRPGGVLYVTVPGVSPSLGADFAGGGTDYWRFTSASIRELLLRQFAAESLTIDGYGNILAALGSLHGLAAEEFSSAELDYRDPAFETLIAARAVRS